MQAPLTVPAGLRPRSSRTIPTAPGAVPLLGHAWHLLRDPLPFLENLSTHGKLVRIRIGNRSALVVCAPELTRQVLLDVRVFEMGGPVVDRARDENFGDGVGTVAREQYLVDRRAMQPSFLPNRIPGYAERMTAHATAMVESWHAGQVLDVFTETQALAGNNLVDCFLAGAIPNAARPQLVRDIGTILSGIYRRALLPPMVNRLPTPANRRYHKGRGRLRDLAKQAVDIRRAGSGQGDLLAALLAASSSTDAKLIDHLVSVATGGIETVARAMAWSLYLVATHPDVERRLHEEVDRVLGGRPARAEQLADLSLAGRVVAESLRMYPPVATMSRRVAVDTELDGHHIPAGTSVFFSQHIVHHLPDVWPDPDRFDPDRWLPDRSRTVPRGAYIPFIDGPRKCIGYQVGLAEVTLALVAVAARWRLSPVPHGEPRPPACLSTRPTGLRLQVAHRS